MKVTNMDLSTMVHQILLLLAHIHRFSHTMVESSKYTTFDHEGDNTCTSLRKGSRLLILKIKIQPLFEDTVKMYDFQIFTDSDRKKVEL